MQVLRRLTLATCAVLGLTAGANASVIVDYQFAGQSLAPTGSDPNVTPTSIGLGAGLTQGNVSNSFAINTPSTSSALAISNNSYFDFTISPSAGYQIDYATLDLTAGKITGFTANYVIRSSIDAYASNIGAGAITANWPTTSLYQTDLSPLFAVTVPTTFRVYVYGNNPALNPIFSQVTVNGTVRLVTPEPATISMLGITAGIGTCLTVARRRRSKTVVS